MDLRRMKMSRVAHQHLFSQNLADLLIFAQKRGYHVSVRTVGRSQEEQARMVKAGKSKTMNSKHREFLAADVMLFMDVDKDGDLDFVQVLDAYEELGIFWENLDPKNTWGGRWPRLRDGVHFERNPRKKVVTK